MSNHPSRRTLQPSMEELLARLEADILWLKRHRWWSRSLFERAVNRFVEATHSTVGLDAFVALHALPDRRPSQQARRAVPERSLDRVPPSQRGPAREALGDVGLPPDGTASGAGSIAGTLALSLATRPIATKRHRTLQLSTAELPTPKALPTKAGRER